MTLKRRSLRDDALWLIVPLSFAVLTLSAMIASWWGAASYQNRVQRNEFNAQSQLELLEGQIEEIEASERIIVENIDLYNRIAAAGILDEEDRVALLDDITTIRRRYNLFPISIAIGEQDRVLLPYPGDVDFPDEQITLRASRVELQMPLLHEGDLTRFLADFLNSERLMLVNQCSVNSALEDQNLKLTYVQHQQAECEFTWYTMRREPYSDLGF